MFEKIINKKIHDEIKKISTLENVTKNSIKYSNIDPFIKMFIDVESLEINDKSELEKIIEKALKLNFNYTIRPKWTIINYIFGNLDSRPSEFVLNKLAIFRFYKYYYENIKSYINEKKIVIITKKSVIDIIDTTDTGLHDKLLTNPSALKTKNFFLQVFKLKHPDVNSINLNSFIPFGFIRIFLEDKLFTGLLEKFNSIEKIDDPVEIDLRTIIKTILGKYVSKLDIASKNEDDNEIYAKPYFQDTEQENLTFEEKSTESDNLISEKELIESNPLLKLFKKNEIEKITKKIFRNDRLQMFETLEIIDKLPDWNYVSEHLKQLFIKNRVSMYNKDVILFIDILQEHFSKR